MVPYASVVAYVATVPKCLVVVVWFRLVWFYDKIP